VTFTVSKLEDNVTIGTAADAGSLADKMQAMVDAANGALGEISKNASYDPASHTGGPLLSDFNVRQLQMNMLSAVSNGDSTYGSFSQLGMSLDSSGKLQFDRTKFLAAYAADPAATQSAVSDGVAGTLKTLATGANLEVALGKLKDQSSWLSSQIASLPSG
jgi:flagellar hook-associated protein 2